VIIEYDQFNYLTYTVKKGQTVWDIAGTQIQCTTLFVGFL